MPFYEYQCKSCGHALEAMQKISESPLKKCPDCGKPQLVRLMSAPVFRLKGGGWYETDFKGDKENQRNLADRPDADAPKDSKDADAVAAAPKAAENGKSAEAKAPEGPGGDAAAKDQPAEKAADQPAEKTAGAAQKTAPSTRKPGAGKSGMRGRAGGLGKSAPKRPARKAAAKSRRSR